MRHCRLKMKDFTIWKPSPPELERIQFCIDYGGTDEVWTAMVDSMEKNCRTLAQSVRGRKRMPTTYAEAVSAGWRSQRKHSMEEQRSSLGNSSRSSTLRKSWNRC